MACVYRHIRKYDGEVFYVGIGKTIKRAYSKKSRSKFWRAYTKNCEYEVEILTNKIPWSEACELEVLLIELYGRRDLKLGPLVNLTDGGDGTLNMSQKGKDSIASSNKNRVWTDEIKNNHSKGRMVPVNQFDLDGNFIREFDSAKSAAEFVGVKGTNITVVCRGKQKTSKGYLWKYK